jgi:hypothetical protein
LFQSFYWSAYHLPGTTETTDGQTGGHKNPNKATGATGPTDGQTGGDKHSNEKSATGEATDGQTGGDKHCLFIEMLITTSLTISSFSCSSLFFIEVLITSTVTI